MRNERHRSLARGTNADAGDPAAGAEPSLRNAVRALRLELRIVNDRIAAAAGLNPRDLEVLDILNADGAATPTRLSQRTGYHRATLTVLLARLERDGWIERAPDPADGRSTFIVPTHRIAELRDLYAPLDQRVAELDSSLDMGQRAAAIDLLKRLADGVRNHNV